MRARFLTILALIFATFTVWADETQDYKSWVKMQKGQKHIYVGELGLSPNMTIRDFLTFFPEATSRGETDILSNYTVKIDGENMGEARDVVLLQMTLSEIYEIVIEDDPSVSYTSNGTGGSIDIKTKAVNEGVSGNAQVDASTESDVLISGNVNYKKDKLKITSSVRADFYDTYTDQITNQFYYRSQEPPCYSSVNYNSAIHQKSFVETAKIGITYTPSAHDELFFTAWETYNNFNLDNETSVISYPDLNSTFYSTGLQEGYERGNQIYALAKLTYTHKFSDMHKMKFNINYNYTKKINAEYEMSYGDCFIDSIQEENEKKSTPHSAFVELFYEGTIYKSELNAVHFKVGVASSFKSSENQNIDFCISHDSVYGLDTTKAHTHVLECSPYTEITYEYSNKFLLYAGGRYNMSYFNNILGQKKNVVHDYMAKIEADYTPTPNHALRLSAVRNGLAPTIAGKTGSVSTANFEYMYDGHFGEHHFNSDLGFQYDRTKLTNVANNIYSVRFSALWQIKWFTASVAAQYFHRQSTNTQKSLNYYTIRFTPIFHLPKDWAISATIMYNSTQYTATTTLGDYVLTSLRASKQIKNWSLHIELNDPIHYKTKDVTYDQINPNIYTETIYNLYNRYLNLGVMYTF